MGGGASNLSSTQLSVYQEAINDVSQTVKNIASNEAVVNMNAKQNINFYNGSSPTAQGLKYNICEEKLKNEKECQSKCYADQYYRSAFVSNDSDRTKANCDDHYGMTYENAKLYVSGYDQYCKVSDASICRNAMKRLYCENMKKYSDMKTCNDENITFYENIDNYGKIKYTKIVGPSASNCINTDGVGPCYNELNSIDDYYCTFVPNSGEKYYSGCLSSCLCTPEQEKLYNILQPPAYIQAGSLTLENTINFTQVTNQISDANTTSTLISNVANQFNNEVTKTITQENSGINLGQFNNSQERTDIIQKVATIVKNAVDTEAKNLSTTNADGVQTINFINTGRIVGCESSDKSVSLNSDGSTCIGGNITLSNKTVMDIKTNQTSKSVATALLQSDIINDLTSKYTYSLTQKNVGFDPLAIIILFAIILGAGILIMCGGGFLILKGVGEALKNPWVWVCVVTIVALCICIPTLIVKVDQGKGTFNTAFKDEVEQINYKQQETFDLRFLRITIKTNVTDVANKLKDLLKPLSGETLDGEKKNIQNALNERYKGFELLFDYCSSEYVVKTNPQLGVTLTIEKKP